MIDRSKMLISVITPSYNRAALLPRLYKSLCDQTCRDFEWIVVDDGSTDNTKDVMASLTSDNSMAFPIRYNRKENGGKHTAVNRGVKEAKGQLVMIADDDDLLPSVAIDIIKKSWADVDPQPSVGGIAGLDINKRTGGIIGSGLPEEHILCNAIDVRYKYHVTGDLKEVFRTDVLREFPFPEINGEKFCPEQLVWFRIAQKYSLFYINKPIYIAEYQSDGITAGITRARMQSPRASMLTYAELTTCRVPFAVKVKAAINYWRFWYCRRADTVVPPIACRWYGLRPVGWMMHRRDNAIGRH